MGGSRDYFKFTKLVGEDDEKVFDENSDVEENGSDSEDDGQKTFPCITVEPVVLLFYMAYSMTSTMRTEYVTERIYSEHNIHEDFRMRHDPWRDDCDRPINASDTYVAKLDSAQADASYWLLIYNLVQIFPAMIVSPLIGSWSDRAGRKKAMLLPPIGYLFGISIWLGVVYYRLSKSYLTIAHFVIGLFGDFPTLLAVSNAYMCDIATHQSRTYRMIILGIVIEFATGISQIAIGFWIFYSGYTAPFWFVFAAIVTAILYITIFVKESNSNASEKPASLFSTSQFDAVYTLFVKATSKKRSQLVSYLVVLGIHMMILHSSYLLVLLFVLSPPLCWTSIIVGFYVACSLLLGSVGTLVGGKIFSSLADDLTTTQVGIWSSLLALTFIAFGDATFVLFIAAMLGSFRFLTSPSMRSRLSKLADEDEQGVLLACASCVESLGNLIGPSLFNLVYSLTLDYFRGLVFLIMAAIYVPTSVIVTFNPGFIFYRDRYYQWYDWIHGIKSAPSAADKQDSDKKHPESD